MADMLGRLMEQAIGAASINDLDGCSERLQQILSIQPSHLEANRMLGKVLLMTGRTDAGRTRLTQAASMAPDDDELAYEAGVACLGCDDPSKAAEWFRRCLALQPAHTRAMFNLGWALRAMGQAAEAAEHFARVAAIQPGRYDAWLNLGNALASLNRYQPALDAYERAANVAQDPDNALLSMALMYHRLGRPMDVDRLLSRVSQAGRRSAAAATLEGERNLQAGDLTAALSCFEAAQTPDGDNIAVTTRTAHVLRRLHHLQRAQAVLETALTRHPDSALLLTELANIRLDRGALVEAIELSRRALADAPRSAPAHDVLGKALSLSGRFAEAVIAYRAARDLAPDEPGPHSNLLFALLHAPHATPEEVFAEHQAFGRRWEDTIPARSWRPRPLNGRRLRIGYVSPDFCHHAVQFFVEPLLHHHDRSRFEVFCYHIPRQTDPVTERFRRLADHWRVLPGHVPQAVETILADQIDILVDLAGHTAFNMLPVFAARPAPIQVSWIGYPGTTGLSRIDYRFTYGNGLKGSDQPRFSSEKLVSLTSPVAFVPPENAPPVTPPPVLQKGYVTFGSLNRYAKINETVRRCWAAILGRLPTAKLLVVAPGGDDPEQARTVASDFAATGIAADRLVIVGQQDLDGWMALHGQVDVALDPFPYRGGTTTPLSQWMGVPILCMDEQTPENLDLCSRVVATSVQSYVDLAVAMAGDVDGLVLRRAAGRAMSRLSIDVQARPVVAEVERHFLAFWEHWENSGA